MRVVAPTLMIWGENDIALGKELTHGTERYVDDLRLMYVPHCGHFVHEEQPELVNRHVLDFVTET
jgi:pimeloyl-ACP methyl ester carboxylesterase